MRHLLPLATVVLIVPAWPAAPVPKDKPKVTPAFLAGLIGKGHLSIELHDLRDALGTPPVALYARPIATDAQAFYHRWADKGVDLSFDTEGRVTVVYLFAGELGAQKGKYKRYAGDLPAGLTFADDMAAVRKKLGDPDDTHQGVAETPDHNRLDCGWAYPAKGLRVAFDTHDLGDEKATVSMVVLKAPRKE